MHDITLCLGEETAPWPGDPGFRLKQKVISVNGHRIRLSTAELYSHSGTHIDFPAHFLEQGKTQGEYALERFYLPATVIECASATLLEAHHVLLPENCPGRAILLRTDNSRKGCIGTGQFRKDFCSLAPAAARKLVACGISLLGIDAPSVDPFDSDDYPVHHLLMEADIIILENADLRQVPAGDYQLCCFPLPISAAEASPVRAVLLG